VHCGTVRQLILSELRVCQMTEMRSFVGSTCVSHTFYNFFFFTLQGILRHHCHTIGRTCSRRRRLAATKEVLDRGEHRPRDELCATRSAARSLSSRRCSTYAASCARSGRTRRLSDRVSAGCSSTRKRGRMKSDSARGMESRVVKERDDAHVSPRSWCMFP
jgi:hypothetical protein